LDLIQFPSFLRAFDSSTLLDSISWLELLPHQIDTIKPGCHLHKYARIYALAVQLEKWQIFMQAQHMLLLAHKYACTQVASRPKEVVRYSAQPKSGHLDIRTMQFAYEMASSFISCLLFRYKFFLVFY
jgi:hypothetical protein